jgi:peptidoglycan/xylan/chitin deacetylase (PgdA/CDA1 family)
MKKHQLILALIFISFNIYSQKIIKKAIPDKLVVLSFDDAPISHYATVAALLKQYNFGATFYVCEFPPNFKDKTKYMSWQQIKELNSMGFEIGNHTRDHASTGKLSPDKFAASLKYIEDTCKALNIPQPITFAYPGYSLDTSNFAVLKQRGYQFARAGGKRVYDPLTDYPYLLPSWAINDKNHDEIMAAFKEAKQGKIVIMTIHGVPDYEHPWVTTQPELLKE